MIKKYRNYLLGVIGVLLALTMLVGIKYLMKPKYEELPEVKLRKINKTKAFAIMVQNGDTYKEYTSEDNTWPGSEYIFKEAKCTDNNGSLVENAITFTDGKATLKTNQTIYCTLYFDEKSQAEITNASKVCDMGTSMSIEFTTSGPVGKYYYSTNGQNFTESSENLYSSQRIEAGTNQKIYVYVTDSNGKRSETKEYDFTTKTLGSPMTASELKASNPKDLNTNDIETQGGMYRYQAAPADANAAAQMTNWVMFGAECTNEYAKLSEADKIDKYMYRIIGITDEGEMKLIKETFIKEGTSTSFTWNDKYYTSGEYAYTCDDKVCPEWNTSLLFKRLNGTSNGETKGTGTTSNNANTDIFVDSEKYDYLRSGDNKNGGTSASEWYNLIADHSWMYGDTTTSSSAADTYNGDKMYAIETGQAETTHYVGTDGSNKSQNYYWPETNKVTAKISLMYIHDYVYSYYDGETEESRGNPGNYSTAKNGWLFFQKDGYNTSSSYEWLSTRWGIYSTSTTLVHARYVNNTGGVYYNSLHTASGVRPVFYLESRAKIVEGDGTKSSPFVIN